MLETFASDFDDVSKSDPVYVSKPVGQGSASDPIVISTNPTVAGSKSDAVPGSFLLTTSLSQPVKKGEIRLQVAIQTGCAPGMTVRIGPHKDKSYETRRINALGSLVLDYPLVNSYPAGTTVVVSNGRISDKRESDQRNSGKDKALSGPTMETIV